MKNLIKRKFKRDFLKSKQYCKIIQILVVFLISVLLGSITVEASLNTDYTKVTVYFTDNTPPSITVEGAPAVWQNSDASASVGCSDTGTGCDSSTYGILTYSSDPGTCSINYSSYIIIGDGSQSVSSHSWVCATAKDNAGNEGFSSPVEFMIDAIAPTITDFWVDDYTDEQDPVYTTSPVTIEWTAEDTGGSEMDHYELWRADDVGGFPDTWSLINNNASSGITDNPGDGTWWYGLHAVDIAGNCIDESGAHCGGVSSDTLDTRIAVGPIQVLKDTSPPSVDVFNINPSSPNWVTSTVAFNVSWTVSGNGDYDLSYVEILKALYNDTDCSDTNKIGCSWSQVNENYDAPPDSDFWESSVSDSPLEEGRWWYGIHVVDNNENWADEGGPIKVQIDTQIPNSQIQGEIPSLPGSWQKGNFTIDTVDEDLSEGPGEPSGIDFDSCEYKVLSYDQLGQTHRYPVTGWEGRTCSDSVLTITVGEDQMCGHEYTSTSTLEYSCVVYVRAYDLAGNKGESSKGYRIDWTYPTPGKLYITDTEAEQIYPIQAGEGVKYNFKSHVTDNFKITGCDLYINNANQGSMEFYPAECSTDCTASTTFTFIGSGTYNNNFVNCIDAAGNIKESQSVTIDVAQGSVPIITDLSYFTSHSSTPDQECANQFACCMEPTTQTDCSVKFNISAYDPDENPLTYTWDFDDGTPDSNDEDPSHHYTSANTYNVLVDVFDGTEHTQDTLVVAVNNPSISVSLTADPAFGTDSLESVDLRAIASGSMFGAINYKFDCTNDASWELEVDNQSINDYTAVDICSYLTPDSYTAKTFIQRGTGSDEDTANIDVVDSECTPGEQTDCTSSQGCSHTITCQENSTWPNCPTDECTISDVQSCGNGGTQTCISSCVWDVCSGEGECSPGPDSPACLCPIDVCVGSDYYNYPEFGDCTAFYSCDTGVGTGQPCEPNITTNDPQCNEAPICDSLGASPEQGVAPLNILFTGSAHDNDGTIANYGFIFGDSESGTTTDNTINHVYNNPGTYCAKLRVQDNDGTWTQIPGDCPAVCAKQINISENNPPLADIDCNGSGCGPGSACNGSWIAYNRNCQFYFLNQSTDANSTNPPDNNNDIIKSTWSIFYQGGTPWQNPYIVCVDNLETPENEGICDLLLPALPISQNYYVTLTVEDSIGATDDYSKNFYVRREVAAYFQCSLNPDEGWQSCNGFVASEGEVVYFKDTSIPSEGSAGISSWSWTFEDGDPATSNNQNPSASFVNVTGNSGTVTLDITDNIGRTDTEQYQLQVTIPLPQWEEVVPF